jgi:asparagine synthase (glutamine-hydrolysing)
MAEASPRPPSTFAIGFSEDHMNEAPFAAQVARHLGTDHHEWIVTGADAAGIVGDLAEMFDEPLADYSQVPTALVSAFARRHVTVALSGDGGDEIFGGYSRYRFSEGPLKHLARVPRAARTGAAGLLGLPAPAQWEKLRPLIARVRPEAAGVGHLGDRVERLRAALREDSPLGSYRGLMSYWNPSPVLGTSAPPAEGPFDRRTLLLCSPTEQMMELDVATYLPGDILCKVDRAGMATSLETRAPLLDHELYEFAWSLPLSMRVDRTAGKKPLRQVLHRHVPAHLVERRKTPFGAPLGEWLRGPLRDWAEDLLSERRLRDDGYLDAAPVRDRWSQHLAGERNWQHHLWGVLMFNAFLDRWKPPAD